MNRDDLLAYAQTIRGEMVAARRHIHQHPELSFEEEQTAAFVAGKLREWGIPHQTGVAGHGVVGWIRGNNPEIRTVALRADMDALPIREANEVPYKSSREGVMHACGHDVHTACLLGAARILQTFQGHFSGTVQLLFQPAEEKLPGGASLMLASGILDHPRPFLIIGQHVHPPLQAGCFGFRGGPYMASSDELYLTLTGKGGHGAMPHETVDPVLLAAQVLVALQQVVSRRANPLTPTVLTFGKIESVGGATNVIPSQVRIEGTFRTMDEAWRKKAHQLIRQTAEGVAAALGGQCECEILSGYPCLVNDEAWTGQVKDWASELVGRESVEELPLRMTSEDFAWYSQVIPACFYRLGTGNPARGITSPVHTDTFDVDEDSVYWGMSLMAWLAYCALSE